MNSYRVKISVVTEEPNAGFTTTCIIEAESNADAVANAGVSLGRTLREKSYEYVTFVSVEKI